VLRSSAGTNSDENVLDLVQDGLVRVQTLTSQLPDADPGAPLEPADERLADDSAGITKLLSLLRADTGGPAANRVLGLLAAHRLRRRVGSQLIAVALNFWSAPGSLRSCRRVAWLDCEGRAVPGGCARPARIAERNGVVRLRAWSVTLSTQLSDSVQSRVPAAARRRSAGGDPMGGNEMMPSAVVGTMAVAARSVHIPNGFFIMAEGWECVAALGVSSVAIGALGGGRFSLDRALGFDRQLCGSRGTAIALGAGLGGAVAQLAAFWRRPVP
jgi:hypothetical protein